MQQKRMHVVILPSWYFPAGSQEITGRMFQQLGQGLRAKGIEANLFYPDFSRKRSFLKAQSFTSEDNLPTYRISQWFPPKANSFLFHWWIKKVVRQFKSYMEQNGKPDVIHAQSYHAGAVCVEIKKQWRIPFIYTERLSSFLTGKTPKHYLPFISEVLSHADVVTCVSEGLQQKLQTISQRDITIVPNFFNEAIFFPDPALQKNEIFTFISVGEPAYTKGLDILLKAFALVKASLPRTAFKLILADRIPEEKDLKSLADALDIAEDISWPGLMTQSEVAGLLRRSHVFVSASRFETFGKATIEAQACGLPVVATQTPGSVSVIKDEFQGLLCEIENANALAQQMQWMFEKYASYDQEKIARHTMDQYGSQVILPKWISIYNTVVK